LFYLSLVEGESARLSPWVCPPFDDLGADYGDTGILRLEQTWCVWNVSDEL
jgi:hypothetical protein